MRTRTKKLLRLGTFWAYLLAALVADPLSARAEADGFLLGDGHRGPKAVAGEEIVNTYAPLTADANAGTSQIAFGRSIGTGGAFAANDLVLVWRATGVAAAEAPSGNQTKRLDLSSALATTSTATNVPGLVGSYELARVANATTTTLTLTKPLVRSFNQGVSQVVRVPEYTTVSIPAGATITAAPWQDVDAGAAGGIVIFLAKGGVSNAGTIHANGRGFRGGAAVRRLLNLSLACPNNDGTPENGYAEKGEGVVRSAYGPAKGGKGNISHGAGGGNCVEGGGGGGANFGNGGKGGGALLGVGTGGGGGVGIDYSLLDRITMGGGGGAGEQKNGETSAGALGGGAIYVRGQSLSGKGRIEANGAAAANATVLGLESDGAGGGGAGGSIVLRFVTTADCDAIAGTGGNGGDTGVVGLPIWGPGGGGGGGRVLFQAGTPDPNCKIVTTPGQPGNGGTGGAGGGGGGGTQPTPTGCSCAPPFCPTATDCDDPTPVCETISGTCKPCGGPFSSGLPLACPQAKEPVCMTTGACLPCNGDFAGGASQACQLANAPYCFLAGAQLGECGRCTTDADCVGHAGPLCNVNAGACGTQCQTDADCKSTEWCAPASSDGRNVCIPKTPNGQPVPGIPPINGECTEPNGKRTCLSSVCEEDDDLCGRKNGSPCGTPEQCRSVVCFPADKLCGLPNGEPCTGNGQCRSDRCEGGLCVGCDEDTDCKLGQVCDVSTHQCIEGCRPGATTGHGGCPPGDICVVPDGSDVGNCQPGPDAGSTGDVDFGGIIEGGGCSCTSAISSATSPLAVLGAAIGVLLVARRRRGTRRARLGEAEAHSEVANESDSSRG